MDAVNYAAALPGVVSVSLSYSLPGTSEYFESEDSVLASLEANNGVALFAASGDDGDFLAGRYPASSPYFTAVGGTRITSVPATMSAPNEVAWEFSEGGASSYAPMPPWQSALLPAASIALNDGMRAVPDVAAVADGQHSAFGVYFKDQWGMAGGTSMASPLWAGVSAMLAERLAARGISLSTLIARTPGGFNGLLYQMKLSRGPTESFYDIVSGSNNATAEPCPICVASEGYDDVTGLGAPDVTQFLSNF